MDQFERLITEVSRIYQVGTDVIVTDQRSNRRAEHRLMAMWVARNHLNMGWSAIADRFSRTHPTCIRNCHRFSLRLRSDKGLSSRLEDLLKQLE